MGRGGEGRGGGHHYMAYILGARENLKISNLFACLEKGIHSLRGSKKKKKKKKKKEIK